MIFVVVVVFCPYFRHFGLSSNSYPVNKTFVLKALDTTSSGERKAGVKAEV